MATPLPKMLGQPIRRREDPRLITGTSQYVDDIHLPGMLHATFVRSQYGHARVNGIDTAAALTVPGVVAVLTAADIQGATTGPMPYEFGFEGLENVKNPQRGPLATDKVRFVGDPLAIVVAETRYAARDGAAAVEVEYEPLPAVVDPEQALEPGAPLLFEEFGTNLGHTQSLSHGDVAGAFAAADTVVSLKIVNQRVFPVAMETRGALADWRPGRPGDSGELTIWTSTQVPHAVKSKLAALLDVPENKVRAIAPEVGGAFGNKVDVSPEEAMVSIAAMRLERPVKWSETRSENLQAAMQGRGQTDIIDAAVRADGRIIGLKITAICDIGAYYQYLSPVMGTLTGLMMPGTYDVPNISFELKGVFTNKTPVGAYRGAGRPEATYLVETTVDKVAHTLGLDPAEVRRINFIKKEQFPYTTPFGANYDTGDYERALDKALAVSGYRKLREEQQQARSEGRIVGIGVGSYVEICGFGPWESATVRVEPTGKVMAHTGTSPHGQGTETSMAQIVADVLGVGMDDIVVLHGDTAMTQTGIGTFGSRSAAVGGGAMVQASEQVQAKARRIAAQALEAAVDDIEVGPDGFAVRGVANKVMTLAQIAGRAYGGAVPEGDEPGLEATRFFKPADSVFPFGVHIAVVEIDRDTGRVHLRKFVAVDDVGNVINPLLLDGQRHGGIVQGVAQALCEEVVYDEHGSLVTGTLSDYSIPTAAMMPMFDLDRTVTTTDRNPLGVKGVGEAGTIGSTPTLRNAVLDALQPFGVTDLDMPATSLKIWNLIHGASSHGDAANGAEKPR
ncbi:MAG: molybdopterin-dependent oxidoreductase [Chloroflexi bacterium]|nr:molybdopterin-dependent oxidoreductase [Chloroflexota bacterium]